MLKYSTDTDITDTDITKKNTEKTKICVYT